MIGDVVDGWLEGTFCGGISFANSSDPPISIQMQRSRRKFLAFEVHRVNSATFPVSGRRFIIGYRRVKIGITVECRVMDLATFSRE